MMKRLFMAVMLASVCVSALAAKKENQYIAASLTLVKNSMTDPESTRFRNVYLMWGVTVCGQVNSKNKMGGYVGFERFFMIDGTELRIEGDGILDNRLWDKYCSAEAMKPPKQTEYHEKSWDDTK